MQVFRTAGRSCCLFAGGRSWRDVGVLDRLRLAIPQSLEKMKIPMQWVVILFASTIAVTLLILAPKDPTDQPCVVQEPLSLRNDSGIHRLLMHEDDLRGALTADLHIPPTLLPVRSSEEWASALSKWEGEHGTAPFLRRWLARQYLRLELQLPSFADYEELDALARVYSTFYLDKLRTYDQVHFIHYVKCGGTAMCKAMKANTNTYPSCFLYGTLDGPIWLLNDSYSNAAKLKRNPRTPEEDSCAHRKLKAAEVHTPIAMNENYLFGGEDSPVTALPCHNSTYYMTLLREPMSRMSSWSQFLNNERKWNLSCADFLSKAPIRDHLSRVLLGGHVFRSTERLSQELFQSAKELLANFDLITLTKDLSSRGLRKLMESAFGQRMEFEVVRRTPNKGHAYCDPLRDSKIMKRHLGSDMEMYQFGKALATLDRIFFVVMLEGTPHMEYMGRIARESPRHCLGMICGAPNNTVDLASA